MKIKKKKKKVTGLYLEKVYCKWRPYFHWAFKLHVKSLSATLDLKGEKRNGENKRADKLGNAPITIS